MTVFRILMILMLLIFGYMVLFLPAFLVWLVNITIFRKAIAKAKHKKTIWLATLLALVGLELGCLFFINSYPFVVYDKTEISDETVTKVLAYVRNHPERYVVEDFGGFRLRDVTFQFRVEIFTVNDDESQLVYDIASVPLGWNHWYFRLDENNEISPW